MTLVLAALTGIGLAACAGLRAFLPLLAAGLAARFADWPLAESTRWLASDASLVVFGVASVVEVLADKVPVLDHALDAAQTVLAPIAGSVVAVSALTDLPAPYALALGIATGAPLAGGVHLLAAATRLTSSAASGGTANPVLSLIEDVVATVGIVVAFVVPVLALLAIVAAAIWLRRWRARRAGASQPAPTPRSSPRTSRAAAESRGRDARPPD